MVEERIVIKWILLRFSFFCRKIARYPRLRGLITIPYKIDIMLSAGNYSKEEAGITRVDNPENFLLYMDAHGERKEKAGK